MIELSDILRPVEADLERYRLLFDGTLTHPDEFLGGVLAHVRGRKGKMMRPLLVLLMAREAGGCSECSLRAAVALELLHTASLVHDDVVDESGERRGQESANAVYGNKIAVLLGDYLLSLSLRQAALTDRPEMVDIIAQLGGTLSEGEIFQLANIRQAVSTEEAYFRIIRHKTAALFAACGQLGALSAGAGADFTELARAFGEEVGVCFQIRDDIFDYFEDAAIGKPTGNDMAEGKLTLPAIYALDRNPDSEMLQLADRVKKGEAEKKEIARLVDFTKREGGIDYARRVMRERHDEALGMLAGFRDAEVRQALSDYLDFVVERAL